MALLQRLALGIERRTQPLPGDRDDRYFAFFALPDAAAALVHWPDTPAAPPAPTAACSQLLSDCGLAVLRTPRVMIVGGGSMAAALMVWSAGQLAYVDSGYAALSEQGRRWVSERHLGGQLRLHQAERGWDLSYRGLFQLADRPRPFERWGPMLHLGARSLAGLSDWAHGLGEALKTRYVARADDAPLRLERRIEARPHQVLIHDRIEGSTEVQALRAAVEPAGTHVPSARIWLPAFEPLLACEPEDLSPELRRTGRAERRVRVLLDQHPPQRVLD
jgi:hypothetical protein